MEKLIKKLWKVFLFSFPFSFHLVLYEKASYRFGNFSPWVTGFLFLPEALLALIFLLWLIQKMRTGQLKKMTTPGWGLLLFLFFILNAGVVTWTQGDMVLYLFFLIRVLEATVVCLLIRQQLIPHNEFVKCLLYGAVFQMGVAYLQSHFNHSVGLHFIGEPVIGPDVANVAKTDLPDGTKVIRPYGTLLHPNILGVYLVTVFYLSLPYLKKKALPFWIILLSVGIYCTGSQAAEVAFLTTAAILLLLSFIKKATQKRMLSLSLLLGLVLGNFWVYLNSAQLAWNHASVQERLMQNVISLNMLLYHFWGVGVAHFTLVMEQFSRVKLLPWEFQPVHNVYFLILNETGLQGLLLILILIAYLLHSYWKTGLSYFLRDKARILPLFALLIVASFDHLLFTSWIGPILIAMVVAETTRTA